MQATSEQLLTFDFNDQERDALLAATNVPETYQDIRTIHENLKHEGKTVFWTQQVLIAAGLVGLDNPSMMYRLLSHPGMKEENGIKAEPSTIVHRLTEAEKYRAFRNFMVNELGIDKAQVREWTTQSLQAETAKIVGQINIVDIVKQRVRSIVEEVLTPNSWERKKEIRDLALEAIKAIIGGAYTIGIVSKEDVTKKEESK